MKRKRLAGVVTVGVILSLGIVGLYSINQDKGESLEPKEKTNMLAMYLEDESGEYKLSSSKEFPKEGYVLNLEKSTCTNGGVLSQDSETKLISLRTSNSSKCDLYFEKEKNSTGNLIAKANPETITNYTDGDTKEMYTFSHPATEQTEALTDYRYIGANPNNWIRFNDEDWRIIGVFTVETESKGKQQLIKIIRDDFIGEIPWDDWTDGEIKNEWSTASLQKLLNGDYYNTEGSFSYTYKSYGSSAGSKMTIPKGLNATARSQIESVKWYLGGFNTTSGSGGQDSYAFERGTATCASSSCTGSYCCSGETRSTNIIQKVGLMYPSDYLYTYANGVDDKCYTEGQLSCNWSGSGTGKPATGWLFSYVQKTQSPHALSQSIFFGFGQSYDVRVSVSTIQGKVRPVVYLTSTTKITGGDGSSGSPYTIE